MLIFMFNHVAFCFFVYGSAVTFFNKNRKLEPRSRSRVVHNTSNISSKATLGYKNLFPIITLVETEKEKRFSFSGLMEWILNEIFRLTWCLLLLLLCVDTYLIRSVLETLIHVSIENEILSNWIFTIHEFFGGQSKDLSLSSVTFKPLFIFLNSLSSHFTAFYLPKSRTWRNHSHEIIFPQKSCSYSRQRHRHKSQHSWRL